MRNRSRDKKYKRMVLSTIVAAGFALSSFNVTQASTIGYKQSIVTTINLPGHSVKGDVVAADSGANKVYIAQQGNNAIDVIDAKTNTVEATVTGINKGYGVTFDKNYIFAASTGDSAVYVISKKNWKIVKKVSAGGKGADGIVYDSQDNTVAVVNDFTNNIEFINAGSPFNIIDTVNLQPRNAVAGPDLPTYVSKTNTLFVPVDNCINVINAKNHKIEHVWKYQDVPVDSKNQLKGLYYDPIKQILWAATTGKKVLAINAHTGREIATVQTTAGSDQIVGDPIKRLLYLGEGEFGGWLGIVNMDTMKSLPDSYPGGKNAQMHSEDVMPGTGYLYAYGSEINKIIVMNIQPVPSNREKGNLILKDDSGGPRVYQLQRNLKEKGISPGPIDGVFGRKTLQGCP